MSINSWNQKLTNPNTWKTWRMCEPMKSNINLQNQKLMNSINNWTLSHEAKKLDEHTKFESKKPNINLKR
jgi:hypothetical protein